MEARATLAGGCFWCIESLFLDLPGITSVTSGYTGGTVQTPTYDEVCTGTTGHFEAVSLTFDPEQITFLQILDLFWWHIDPLDRGGQFADRGSQYQTAIFYHDAQQKVWAELSKNEIATFFSEPIATQILPAAPFFPAEGVHQGYCHKNPRHFQQYEAGHLPHLRKLWEGKHPSQAHLREKLTPLQYHVTQEEGTEPPFQNAYWDHHEEGIYVDIVSGEPLFSSEDKFDSGSGWPSFTQALIPLVELQDTKLGTPRTEVRSPEGNSHLGHLFPDGPLPTGLRYCVNSAALRFIPKR